MPGCVAPSSFDCFSKLQLTNANKLHAEFQCVNAGVIFFIARLDGNVVWLVCPLVEHISPELQMSTNIGWFEIW